MMTWTNANQKPQPYKSVIVWGILEYEDEPDTHEGFWGKGSDWHSVRPHADQPRRMKISAVTHWMPMPKAPGLFVKTDADERQLLQDIEDAVDRIIARLPRDS